MMKFDRGRIFLKIYYFGYVTERDFWKQNPDKKFQNVFSDLFWTKAVLILLKKIKKKWGWGGKYGSYHMSHTEWLIPYDGI